MQDNMGQVVEIVSYIEDQLAEGIDLKEITVRSIESDGISTQRKLERLGGLNKIKKSFFPETEKDLVTQTKMNRTTSYVNKLEKKLGAGLVDSEFMAHALSNLPKITIKAYKKPSKNKMKRMLTLVLSDLHIGSDIKKEETGYLDFNRIEESRRLAKIIQETMDYKVQYRKETELNVLLLGDLIQGNLGHDPRDGAPIAEQVVRAIHLLGQGLAQLATSFPKVNVYANTGNHGRNIARHAGRAVQQKWDSYETIIAYALKKMLSGNSNVVFHIPLTPYISIPLFNKKLFATHGDTVLKVGFPGSSIKTGSLEAQVNKINATLPDSDEYSVVVVGHVHTASITHMSNGAVLLTNGALVPSDEFAISIGIMESVCGQYLFESIPDYPMGDCRLIKLTKHDDMNKELDKIIKPFESM